ncbi:MAG: CPBP family intramembrane metalloprotease [Actinomycetota bacterium]|nr:CPBP family intramembrane metalloprotease [Actinomycetota bacterium]
MKACFVRFAIVFYTALFFAAMLPGVLRHRDDVLVLGDKVLSGLFAGAVTACGMVVLGVFSYRLLPVLRGLSDELGPLLVDDARRVDLVLVAVFSGVGEEVFFRGVLQPELGIVLASLLFGVLHLGPDRRYLIWTFWAVGVGFLFGFLYERTGGLLAPIIAHVMHNAATLLIWKRYRTLKGLKGSTVEGRA